MDARLAQKGGATWNHIQIANRPEGDLHHRVDTAQADLVIACDPLVAAQRPTLATMRPRRTWVALNRHGAPTASLVRNPDGSSPRPAATARWNGRSAH